MPKLTYQYRIYPYGDQVVQLESWLEACRRVYNAALEQRKLAHQHQEKVSYLDQQKELTQVRAEFPECRAVIRFCYKPFPFRGGVVDIEIAGKCSGHPKISRT